MSKDTRQALSSTSSASYAPREGVFIPRKQAQKMRRARDLLDDAQRRARDLLGKAEAEATTIRDQAFSAGYEDGALASASHVLAHFSAAQDLAQRLRNELERHAHDLLGESLDHPEAVLNLLAQCLQGLAGPSGQRIAIRLPLSMRGQRKRLNALIEQSGQSAVEIDYHDDSRFIVLYGEQVFEFDPPAMIEQGKRRLLTNYTALEADSISLSEAAAQRWRDAFEQRFIGRLHRKDAYEFEAESETDPDTSILKKALK